ncbi:hypothetical protein CBS101457_005159 [Exobasidium rhododendri]|nr:hypothetical protein CBS101457_005159 [Exobasidium rhododendri]
MQLYDSIPERLFAFIKRSNLFFVATAPLEGGSVNVSPKSALGSFEVVNERRVRYLDLTGSGNETISHLLQPGNGRITIMFVNIEEGSPNIVRLYGKGTVHERLITGPESKFGDMVPTSQTKPPGTRALIDISVHLCTTSCGYSIPIYKYVKERKILRDWSHTMEDSTDIQAMEKKYKVEISSQDLFLGTNVEGRPAQRWLEAYWIKSNALSLDGLPGLRISRELASEEEKEELRKKKARFDQLEAPKDNAGPFRPSLLAPPTSTSISSATSTSISTETIHLIVAFSIGCALTASLFLAPRLLGVAVTAT